MREEKQLLLDDIKERIENSHGFVIASYSAMNALVTTDFRNKVHESGADFEVVPKRVFLKAAEAAGVDDIDPESLEGSIGIVFATQEDPIPPTKTVFEFCKETGKLLKVVGGRIDGKTFPAEDMEKLSKLPGRDEMRSQLLATFEAPMAQTLSVFNALLTSVPFCLDNKAKKEAGES